MMTFYGLIIMGNYPKVIIISFGACLVYLTRRATMSNIYTIHPPKSDLILFYEVVEPNGENTWGGADAAQAMQWLFLAPVGSRLLVSAWDSDEEDAHLVGQTIDITKIIQQAREVGL
jgi:hypothetical protein